jgi:hypothetical protein
VNIGSVFFDLRGDGGPLQVDARKAAEAAGAAGSKSFGSKFSTSIKQGLGIGAGIGMFGLLEDAVGRAKDALVDIVTAGIEEQASIQKMTSSLAANIPAWDGRTDAIEKVITAQMNLGFSDEEQRASLALLVAATHDVTKAQNIQRVAMDLARFKGISLADATDALTKVEAGSYRILKSLGIVLKDGATQTEALAAVQKVAGGQAKDYAATVEGKLLIAQTKWGEKMDELGTAILPAVNDALDDTLDVLNAIDAASDMDLPDRLNVLADVMNMVANVATPGLGSGFDALKEAEKRAAEEADRAAGELARSWDTGSERVVIAAANAGAAVEDAGGNIIRINTDVGRSWSDFVDQMVNGADAIISGAFDPLITADKLAATNAEISAARKILASKTATDAQKADARALLNSLGKDQAEYLLDLAKTGDTTSTAYKTGIAQLRESVKNATGPTKEHLQEVLDKLLEIERVGEVVPINFKTSWISGQHHRRRATGGPVSAGALYSVNERPGQTEYFVPSTDGYVYPSVPSGLGSGPSLAAAGMTFVYAPTYSSASPGEAQRFARDVGPSITRWQQDRGLVGAR